MRTRDWQDFWNGQDVFSDEFLGWNVNYFLDHCEQVLDFRPTDRVLDIGCGPGYLTGALAPRVREICALDVAEKYVAKCRQRVAGMDNASVFQLGNDYTDFSMLAGKQFDTIVCLTVIQYYRSKADVRKLIQSVKDVAAPGARFLIADIPVATSLIQDLKSLLVTSWREGMLPETLRFVLRAGLGRYSRFHRDLGLLTFTQEELFAAAEGLTNASDLFSTRLTVTAGRSHLLLRFQ